VEVTNAEGCKGTDQVTVFINNTATVSAGNDATICGGSSTQLFATGGSNYIWSPATGLSNPNIANPIATPTTTTIYSVTATSGNGCTSTDNVLVTVLGEPTVNPSIVNPGCCNNNGSITLSVFGGSGNMTYNWTPNVSTTSTANNLAAGNYIVVITDARGCDVVANINLTQNCDNCQPLASEREVCVDQNATMGEICFPVPLDEIGNYQITAQGQTIVPDHGCDFQNLTASS